MKSLVLLAAALLVPQEANEAEKLFRKMEEKLSKVNTLQLKLKGVMDSGTLDVSGELLLDEGNRARAEVTMNAGGMKRSFRAISEGKMTQVTAADGNKLPAFTTPEHLGKLVRKSIAMGGVLAAVDALSDRGNEKVDPEKAFVAKDFKLGTKEKVGDREAQSVEYKLSTKYEAGFGVTLWIDTTTGLPLKRSVKSALKTIEESYFDFKLDEKIDPAKFELPKESK